MSLPIVRQQNPPQIRMTVENHAEQIVSFAFVPVCSSPYAGDGWHVNVFLVQQNL